VKPSSSTASSDEVVTKSIVRAVDHNAVATLSWLELLEIVRTLVVQEADAVLESESVPSGAIAHPPRAACSN